MLRSIMLSFWIFLVPRMGLYGSKSVFRLRVATLDAIGVPMAEIRHLDGLNGFMLELGSLLWK